MDDYRFRSQQSPLSDAPSMNPLVSPTRHAGRLPPAKINHDPRAQLPRRFTTDSGRVPTLSTMTSMTSPHRGGMETPPDYTYQKVHLIEQKKLEYERIREQRRRFELEMQRLDQQQRREAQELAQMEEEFGRIAGHQSEPTTPPEYRDSVFPSFLSKPNRYSTSSLTSPPGIYSRSARSGSQLASPPSAMGMGRFPMFEDPNPLAMPSRSVPGTRRNSDDEEKDGAVRQDPTSHRATNALNRYSMPVTRSRAGIYDPANTAGFLFGDDEPSALPRGTTPDENFPTLVRRDDHMLSASSAALDLALAPSPNPEGHSSSGWRTGINRHRAQQSLPAINGVTSNHSVDFLGSSSRPSSVRHSLDFGYVSDNAVDSPNSAMSPRGSAHATPPKLQSSFSSSDVPTVKNTSGMSGNANNHAQQHFHNHNASIGRIPAGAVHSRHTRELSGDSSVTQPREQNGTFPSITSALQASAAPFGPSTTAPALMSSTTMTSPPTMAQASSFNTFYPGSNGYAGPNDQPGAAGYNMNMLTAGMQHMNMSGLNGAMNNGMDGNPNAGMHGMNGMNGMNGMSNMNGAMPNNLNGMGGMTGMSGAVPGSVAGGMNGTMNGSMNGTMNGTMNGGMGGGNMYAAQPYSGYGSMPYNQGNQSRDSQARVIQNRRQVDNEAMARFQNTQLEEFRGKIYELCKDQHGCRFLQRKLEERNADQVHLIWLETNMHVIELMTDPFGNYLCQKLLEFCNDDERTVLIQNSSQDMVRIALNQHGTRALQKMIEFINTPPQIQIIIEALRFRVVELIQDLNGNHVIQKCLNKLVSADAQFIFDAVGNNCVEVGTHRHGCCVLQRCIDHASGEQKLWLIQRITDNARVLVQDPFGNYVVQYIIDLNEPTFTEPVVAMFRGCISQLSRHKFSSNVIEKCLRCSQPPSKDMIVEEMLVPQELERLLRDSFANYVIQTALEYATPTHKTRLVEGIRPLLPQIRTTPYGRRIQAKIAAYDNRGSAATSGQSTPADNVQGQVPLRHVHTRGFSGSGGALIQPNGAANGSNPTGLVTPVAVPGGTSQQNLGSHPQTGVASPPSASGRIQQQPQYTQGLGPAFTPNQIPQGSQASEQGQHDGPWM